MNYSLFYKTLFDVDREDICLSNDVFAITLTPAYQAYEYYPPFNFVTINPLKYSRKDENVTVYRNILLEFDQGTIEEQLAFIHNIRIPFATLVFSGKKSIHAVISLEDPCKDRASYDALVKRIYKKVPQADQSTKNPSRFTRAPGANRAGIEQKFIGAKRRISMKELELWLGPEDLKTEQPVIASTNQKRLLKGTTLYFLAEGANEGYWNRALFLAALDMLRSGYSDGEVLERLREVTGKLDKKDRSTIRSAIKTFQRGE